MGSRLTNELRDKILFENIALGFPPKDIAKKYGVTPQTITRQRDVFEKTKARDWGGVKDAMRVGTFGINLFEWACDRAHVEPPNGFIEELTQIQQERNLRNRPNLKSKVAELPNTETGVQDPPKPENPVTGAKTFIPAPSAELGWQTRIEVKPDRLCMKIYFNGVQQVEGFSRIKENKELALVQAISYAAHMCYKIVEQRKLGGK